METSARMMLYRSWTHGKFVIVVLLIWCRLIGENIIGVNCNFNHFHNILMRNTFPCAINTLCMCTNAGNGTHSYKISCHDVWFYKFTGKSFFSDVYCCFHQILSDNGFITEKLLTMQIANMLILTLW